MKTSISLAGPLLIAGAVVCLSTCPSFAADEHAAAGAESNSQVVTNTGGGSGHATVTVKLPYGVDDVLKLSHAQISEDIVLNYVRSSGTIYNLSPNDIVYLKNEGVSDRVLNAMLDQRKRVTETASPSAPPESAVPNGSMPAYQGDPNLAGASPSYGEPAPVYVEPPPPASTVYVIPHTPASYNFYAGYAPYGYYRPYGYGYPYYGGWYGGYGGYFRPSLSFGFRFGGGGHFRHHR